MGEDRVRWLDEALDIEREGAECYERAASECKNELCKRVFQMLHEDEITHMRRMEEIHAALASGEGWRDGAASFESHADEVRGVFERISDEFDKDVRADSSDLDALKAGMELELAAIGFYSNWLKLAADPAERAFVERLIKEENGHYAALSDMHLYLTDPEAWFMKKEKSTLDGA